MNEREFQNMFTFCVGFEAAALKIPTAGDYDEQTKKQIVKENDIRLDLQSFGLV